jgi:3-hydroxyisobutyrate dehydrogenase-like beta-hydroxyacid dehydrogenase
MGGNGTGHAGLEAAMQDCHVGVIGVGNMGRGIASSYLRAGHATGVFDISPSATADLDAAVASSPAELAAHCNVISIAVRGEDHLEAAAYWPDGLLAGVRTGATLVIHTNVPPDHSRLLAERAAEKGARVIEATMTGGITAAASGSLTLMFAGDPDIVEECWPTLRAIAKRRLYVGRLGAAGVCKGIQDTLFGLHQQTTNEMLQLALAAGVEADRLFEALCAKGWLLERWHEYWTADGVETIGRSLSTPRMPLETFTPWLWSLADELGVDIPSSKETATRSLAILDQQRRRGQFSPR